MKSSASSAAIFQARRRLARSRNEEAASAIVGGGNGVKPVMAAAGYQSEAWRGWRDLAGEMWRRQRRLSRLAPA